MDSFSKKRLNWAAVAALVLGPAPVWACYAPPPALTISVDEQIAAAGDVVVAKVVNSIPRGLGPSSYEYRFVVQQRLAGAGGREFTLSGSASFDGGSETTYARHADPAFWARGGGRTMNGPDCAMHPNFMVGNSYLVFLGGPATWRSFERIEAADGGFDHGDQWFRYVTTRLRERRRDGAGADAVAAKADDDRLARFIDAFHRHIVRQDLEVGMARPLALGHPSAGLVQRARRLAEAFDRILAERGQTPDAAIDAVLQEAAAVGALIQALPAGG